MLHIYAIKSDNFKFLYYVCDYVQYFWCFVDWLVSYCMLICFNDAIFLFHFPC
jgi:hypothetical protein